MTAKRPVFIYLTCMACGLCDEACPLSCLALEKLDVDDYKKAYPVLIPASHCTGCSICYKICPVDAILMQEIGV